MRKLYFTAIFIFASLVLNAQNVVVYNNKIYDIGLNTSDVDIKRIETDFYEISVRYKKDIDSVSLCVKYSDGSVRKLYYIKDGVKEYIFSKTHSVNAAFADAFKMLVPNNVFAEDGDGKMLRLDSMPYELVIKSFASNKNIYKDNFIVSKIAPPKTTKPTLRISSLYQTYNTYTVYITYSGGIEKPLALYCREGNTNSEYKYIPLLWSFDKNDAVGIKITDTYIKDIGKEMVVKLFFQMKENDRYIYINAFDENGMTETYPVEIILKGSGIKEEPEKTEISSGVSQTPSENRNVKTVPILNKDRPEKPKEKQNEVKTAKTNIISSPEKTSPEIKKEAEIQQKPYVNILPAKNEANNNISNVVAPAFYSDNIDRERKEISDIFETPDQIRKIISDNKSESLDLVFVFDATGSMKDVLNIIKNSIEYILDDIYANYEPDKIRIGFVFFKDIKDEYFTKVIPYSSDRKYILRVLKSIHVSGGGDIPEPILDAVDVALNDFHFEASTRLIVVVTDAPIKESVYTTKDIVFGKISRFGVKLEYLKLPDAEAQ